MIQEHNIVQDFEFKYGVDLVKVEIDKSLTHDTVHLRQSITNKYAGQLKKSDIVMIVNRRNIMKKYK